MPQKKSLVAITGASSGIGAATAARFAREGFPVALLARRLDRLQSLKNELPGKIFAYELDVTDRDRVEAVFAQIEQEAGPIGVLVNNAGVALGLEPAYETSREEWDQMIDTNIRGLVFCTRAVLPLMVARNGGQIINLGSIAGTYPYPGANVYGATKAFVHQFSLNLRADLLGKNIRVNCIEPGLVGGSEFSAVRFRGDTETAKTIYSGTQPLTPEDVAEVAYFCHALPPHVNINTVEFMPVLQASAPLMVHKET
jgi:3-hydroxy acid dehydrogenase/malonic semialdehyde reductase